MWNEYNVTGRWNTTLYKNTVSKFRCSIENILKQIDNTCSSPFGLGPVFEHSLSKYRYFNITIYIQTYWKNLISRNRGLYEKAIVIHVANKFSVFYRHRSFITVLIRAIFWAMKIYTCAVRQHTPTPVITWSVATCCNKFVPSSGPQMLKIYA